MHPYSPTGTSPGGGSYSGYTHRDAYETIAYRSFIVPPLLRGEGGAVRHQRGKSHRRWLITVMLVTTYDVKAKHRANLPLRGGKQTRFVGSPWATENRVRRFPVERRRRRRQKGCISTPEGRFACFPTGESPVVKVLSKLAAKPPTTNLSRQRRLSNLRTLGAKAPSNLACAAGVNPHARQGVSYHICP